MKTTLHKLANITNPGFSERDSIEDCFTWLNHTFMFKDNILEAHTAFWMTLNTVANTVKADPGRSLLRRALSMLRHDIECHGGCEHEVGICCCDIIKLADEITTYLEPWNELDFGPKVGEPDVSNLIPDKEVDSE